MTNDVTSLLYNYIQLWHDDVTATSLHSPHAGKGHQTAENASGKYPLNHTQPTHCMHVIYEHAMMSSRAAPHMIQATPCYIDDVQKQHPITHDAGYTTACMLCIRRHQRAAPYKRRLHYCMHACMSHMNIIAMKHTTTRSMQATACHT